MFLHRLIGLGHPKLEAFVPLYTNSTTLHRTIAPPSTTATTVLRRRLSLLCATLLRRCGYTSTVQEDGFVPTSSCSWRRRMGSYTVQGLLPQWSDVVAPMKVRRCCCGRTLVRSSASLVLWGFMLVSDDSRSSVRRDLDCFSIEDRGNVVISHD